MWNHDPYSLVARLSPAILLLIPIIFTFLALYDTRQVVVPLPIYLLCTFSISLPLTRFVRTRGKARQRGLWIRWGGSPLAKALTAPMGNISQAVHDRALSELRTLFPNDTPAEGPVSAYENAGTLIATHTTEIGARIIAKENLAYGFARNTLGVRWIGVCTSVTCMLASTVLQLRGDQQDIWIPVAINGLFLAWWIMGVKEQRVCEAGDRYAEAVIRWLAARSSGQL